jgi:hypothetical protein
MTFCDYHVLEYTCSELQPEGTPFAIVLYLGGTEQYPLKGFVLKSWESTLPRSRFFEISSIMEFLDDLLYYSQETEELSRTYFLRLDTLNVGPIRKLVSGTCPVGKLDEVIATFFGTSGIGESWQQIFDSVSPPRVCDDELRAVDNY